MTRYTVYNYDVFNTIEYKTGWLAWDIQDHMYAGKIKVTQLGYCQAWVLKTEVGTILQSYNTLVAMIDTDGRLWCSGIYSATTRQHIGKFAKMFGLDYYDFKAVIK